MRTYFLLLALICVIAVGCKKTEKPQQVVSTASETFSLKEADTLMAQPTNEKTQQVSVTEAQAPSATVSNEAVTGAAEGAAISASTETPDEMSIQKALKNLGLYQGEVDGKVGPKTKEAIKEFQTKNNLTADGKVGPKTWAILKNALEQAPATTTAPVAETVNK